MFIRKLIPASVKKKIRSYLKHDSIVEKVEKPYQINIVSNTKLSGKVAVVTGGNGAIGRAISVRLAAEGASVYICGRNEVKVAQVVSEINHLGGIAHPCYLDVSMEDNIVEVFGTIANKEGKIDILVNSAGGSSRSNNATLINQHTEVIDSILNTNLRGAILCTREAAKIMVDKNYGRIINISSIIGDKGKARFSEYAAAKAGIIAFSKSVAMEVGASGITVNCVSPGIVQRGEITSADMEKIKKTNYLCSYCTPEDIANSVAFLSSDEANFITGQNIIVDGGRSLGLKGG